MGAGSVVSSRSAPARWHRQSACRRLTRHHGAGDIRLDDGAADYSRPDRNPPPRLVELGPRRPRVQRAPSAPPRRRVVLGVVAALALIAGVAVGAGGRDALATTSASAPERLLRADQDAGRRGPGVVRRRASRQPQNAAITRTLALHPVRPDRRRAAPRGGADLRRRARPVHAGDPVPVLEREHTFRRRSSRSGSLEQYFHASTAEIVSHG